jgi:hypothetical protein
MDSQFSYEVLDNKLITFSHSSESKCFDDANCFSRKWRYGANNEFDKNSHCLFSGILAREISKNSSSFSK